MRKIEVPVVDIQMIVAVLTDVLVAHDEQMEHDLLDDVVYALAYFESILKEVGERA